MKNPGDSETERQRRSGMTLSVKGWQLVPSRDKGAGHATHRVAARSRSAVDDGKEEELLSGRVGGHDVKQIVLSPGSARGDESRGHGHRLAQPLVVHPLCAHTERIAASCAVARAPGRRRARRTSFR